MVIPVKNMKLVMSVHYRALIELIFPCPCICGHILIVRMQVWPNKSVHVYKLHSEDIS